MIRKALFILLPLVLLIGAFFTYFRMQPHFSITADTKSGGDQFENLGGEGQFIRPGKAAWVKQFDRQGQLYCQFKSDYYNPQPDGNVKVTQPVIQFYLSQGQVLQIVGKEGVIRFNPGMDRNVMANAPNDPPRYGTLRTVTVQLFSSSQRLDQGDPQMTMTMPNAQFDNDTYRLFTQDYVDDSGSLIHADDIPVQITAKDYSFNGTGLVLYWNDVDKRLKSLEIAHGHDLVIYNSSGFSTQPAPGAVQSPPPAPSQPSAPVAQPAAPAPIQSSAPTPASPATERRRYLATFYDNVRVLQADQKITGDRMEVDFASKESQPQSNAAETSSPALAASVSTPSPVSPATAPAAAAATQPSTQPVRIFWTGKMRMVPNDESTTPLEDGKAIVRFVGGPVMLHQTAADQKQSVDVQCDDLRFNTADSSAHLAGDLVLRQTRVDGVASTVTGQIMDFSRLTHEARFGGPGQAVLPDPNDPKTTLTSTWQKSCLVRLYDLDKNQMQIESADLAGDVVVRHPKFNMTARDDVKLRFDVLSPDETRQSSSPPLREIDALGDAVCKVHEADQRVREISGQSLEMFRDPGADGKLYAHTIVCDGSVFAQQDEQNISAEHLRIGLLPAKPKTDQPDQTDPDTDTDVALDTLDATTNVKAAGKDASSLSGDELHVKMVDDHAHVTVLGSPDQDAVLKGKNSTLAGPIIHFSPHDQTASIEGPGTFEGQQAPKNPGDRPRPMKMAWQQGATLDGNINQVIIVGAVTAATDSPDGTHELAASDRMIATLVDVTPTTQPAARTSKPGDDSDFMKNKQVKSLALLADSADSTAATRPDAQIQSYNALHQYDLRSQRIDYDVSSRRLYVNGSGRILAREMAPASTQPATGGNSPIEGRGITAIQWNKTFIFDDASHAAVIEGAVVIVHYSDDKKASSIRIDGADIVQADLVASDEKTQTPDEHLKSVRANGPMLITTSDQKRITCGEIEFDPIRDVLICRGGQLGTVTVVDENNIDNNGTFADVTLDTKTNNLIKLTDLVVHAH